MGAAEDQFSQRFGREFPAGTVLFVDGEPGREMFVVQSGLVQISKKVRDVEKVLGRLGAGEFFGEMALLNGKPRNATATVLEDARLLVIDHRTFEAMVRGNIEIAVRLIRKLALRLEESNEQIENLLLRDANSRVAHLLWRLSARLPATDRALRVPVSVREIPARVGLRQDQVDEVLARMARAKLVAVSADGIHVPDVSRLKQYLDFLEMKERFGEL
jgi:CRP-like cAMP-binding protein